MYFNNKKKAGIGYLNCIKSQFFLLFKKKSFWISFTLALGFVCYNFIIRAKLCKGEEFRDYYTPFLQTILNKRWGTNSENINIIRSYIMFFVCIPFGFSFFDEISTGCDNFLITRVNKRKYVISKIVVGVIACFIVIFGPLMVEVLLNNLCLRKYYGTMFMTVANYDYLTYYRENHLVFPYLKIFIKSPLFFSIVIAFRYSIFWALSSMLVYAFALFIKKYRILIFLPLYTLIYVSSSIKKISVFKNCNFDIVNYAFFDGIKAGEGRFPLVYMLLIIMITIICIEISVRREATN